MFDGRLKPAIKRNKRSGLGDGVATSQAKRLIRLFGFAFHMAPGEAEAECALLQRNGIVDGVLSEDVDTIMFGCTRTLRNWSSEGKGSKQPTHMSIYDTQDQKLIDTGLDREGMALVAVMSGGDYAPDGIPGCGVKIACEAAKAGFGKSLCRLKTSDKEGIKAWRKNLVHELQTNESNYFRTKHKSLTIPSDFPDMEIVRLYTHPVISPLADIEAIRERLLQQGDVDLESLREFTRETFDWDYRGGALKFIKVMAEALLVHRLRQAHEKQDTTIGENLVKKIASQRLHMKTDTTPELRVAYIPQDVVPIDLSQEVEETVSYAREGLALDNEAEGEIDSDRDQLPTSSLASESAPRKDFVPTEPQNAWILESVAKRGAPRAFQAFEEVELMKAVRKVSPKKPKGTKKKNDMPYGAIEGLLKITKKTTGTSVPSKEAPKEAMPPTDNLPSLSMHQTTSSAPKKASSSASPTKRLPAAPRSALQNRKSKSKAAAAAIDPIIILSSSPPSSPGPGPASTPPESPSSRPRPVSPESKKVPDFVQSLLSAGAGKAPMKKANTNPRPKLSQGSPLKPVTKLTQTSLDMFTVKTNKQKSSSPPDSVFGSDSEPDQHNTIPSSASASSLSKRRPKVAELPPAEERKKKLLLVSDETTGLLREIEVDEGEREQLEVKLGGKSRVTRYSDFSVVDLTED